jgi:hypothetical protein
LLNNYKEKKKNNLRDRCCSTTISTSRVREYNRSIGNRIKLEGEFKFLTTILKSDREPARSKLV